MKKLPLVVVARDINDVINIQVEREHDLSTPVLRLSSMEAAVLEKTLAMMNHNRSIQTITETASDGDV